MSDVKVTQCGDVTQVAGWPNIIFPSPGMPKRKRFVARFGHSIAMRAFPTRKSAIDWLVLRLTMRRAALQAAAAEAEGRKDE